MVYDVHTLFSPLTKVFWKGEFEGKNLFFKKGRRGAAPNPRCRAFANTRSRWSLVLFLLKILSRKERIVFK
ncbi:MAG: hypothetical protein IKX40_12985, partial [Thermoguttaceae bacterium]|nr:hypothetical protein [Thermoguttaceae bacterium]